MRFAETKLRLSSSLRSGPPTKSLRRVAVLSRSLSAAFSILRYRSLWCAEGLPRTDCSSCGLRSSLLRQFCQHCHQQPAPVPTSRRFRSQRYVQINIHGNRLIVTVASVSPLYLPRIDLSLHCKTKIECLYLSRFNESIGRVLH